MTTWVSFILSLCNFAHVNYELVFVLEEIILSDGQVGSAQGDGCDRKVHSRPMFLTLSVYYCWN